ncbi:MAG: response regulator transcription factor [Anaerolineaceae bacterium]|nr:response regulator transcription factor [Anaerolineaceae bacterium]
MNKDKKIKIFLVDNHVLFRKGLMAILNDYDDLNVIGDVSTYQECIPLLLKEPADLLVMDTDFRNLNAFEIKNNIIDEKLSTRVIAVTLSKTRLDFLYALKSGINGYLLKDEEVEILVDCLRKIHIGRFIISEAMIEKLVHLLIEKNEFPVHSFISERELEVLQMLETGLSNQQISKRLFLSENTIKTHIKHIFKKLSVTNRKDAIEKAILWGLL